MTLLTLLGASTISFDGSAGPAATATVQATGDRTGGGTADGSAASAVDAIAGRLYSGSADVDAVSSSLGVSGGRLGIGIIDITASGIPADAAGERGPSRGPADVTVTATITAPGRKGGLGSSVVDPGLHTVDRAGAKAGDGIADSAATDSAGGSGVLGGGGTADTTVPAVLAGSGAKDVAGSADTQAAGNAAGSGGQDWSGTADVAPASSSTALTGRKKMAGTADPITADTTVSDSGEMPTGAQLTATSAAAAGGDKTAAGMSIVVGFGVVQARGGRTLTGTAATTAGSATAAAGTQGRFTAVDVRVPSPPITAAGAKLGANGAAALVTSGLVNPPAGKKRMAAPFNVADTALIGNPGRARHVGAADDQAAASAVSAAGHMVGIGAAGLGSGSASATAGSKTAAGTADWVIGPLVIAASGAKSGGGHAGLVDGNVTYGETPATRIDPKQLASCGVG